MEIVLGGDDLPGTHWPPNTDTSNRDGPDAELDAGRDGFAQRIASFDRTAIITIQNLINNVSYPVLRVPSRFQRRTSSPHEDPWVRRSWHTCSTRGLQTPSPVELNLGKHIAP